METPQNIIVRNVVAVILLIVKIGMAHLKYAYSPKHSYVAQIRNWKGSFKISGE